MLDCTLSQAGGEVKSISTKSRDHLEPNICNTVWLQYVGYWHNIIMILPICFFSILEHRPKISFFQVTQSVKGLNLST